MNKALTTIIAACMAPLFAPAQETATIDGVKYFLLDGEATVMAQTEQLEGDIVIPETVRYGGETYSVVSLVDEAFANQDGITSVTLPNSVTELGKGCFSRCGGLESITLSENLTSLPDQCLYWCDKLTSITIPEGVTSLGDECFDHCQKLKSVTLPEGLTTLGDNCFSYCSFTTLTLPESLTTVGDYCFFYNINLGRMTLPDGITSLGNSCFSQCTQLISVDLPKNITSLGEYFFYKCSKNLKEVTLPEGITSIGKYCFSGCTNLTTVTLPSSVTSIGGSCFQYCSNLESINLPNGIDTISSRCFSECSKLESITLPNSVTVLGSDCFQRTALKEITLPNSIKVIGSNSFRECTSLLSVTCQWGNLDNVNTKSDAFKGIFSEAALHIPEGTADVYKAKEPWNQFKYIIEDGKPVTIEKCATPEISYRDKQLTFTSATEGAKYHYTITAADATSAEAYTETGNVTLAAAYGISVYASAEGYANSDAATATLYFFDGSFDATAIAAPEARRALLVTADGRTLTVSGLADGETATLYSLQGTALDTARAAAGQARLDTRGEKGVVILKAGADTIKLSVK